MQQSTASAGTIVLCHREMSHSDLVTANGKKWKYLFLRLSSRSGPYIGHRRRVWVEKIIILIWYWPYDVRRTNTAYVSIKHKYQTRSPILRFWVDPIESNRECIQSFIRADLNTHAQHVLFLIASCEMWLWIFSNYLSSFEIASIAWAHASRLCSILMKSVHRSDVYM